MCLSQAVLRDIANATPGRPPSALQATKPPRSHHELIRRLKELLPTSKLQRGTASLSLRLRVEVAGVMPLVQLTRWLAPGAVDHSASLRGGALSNLVRPAQDIGVGLNLQKLAHAVELALDEGAVPGPDRHVGDGCSRPPPDTNYQRGAVEYVELAFDFHRVPVDGVFILVGAYA